MKEKAFTYNKLVSVFKFINYYILVMAKNMYCASERQTFHKTSHKELLFNSLKDGCIWCLR